MRYALFLAIGLVGCGCGSLPETSEATTPAVVARTDEAEVLAKTTTLSLHSGWNPVAFPGPVTNITVPANVGSTSDLKNIDPTKGYWMYAQTPANVSFASTDVTAANLTLTRGWNMVAFPGTHPFSAEKLTATGGQVLPRYYLLEADARSAAIDVNAGTNLMPGRAYWVYASAPLTLSYNLATPATASVERAWTSVGSFACQLQGANVDQLAASKFGMLIVDPDNIGAKVKSLKKLSVAYLSVGEAENYRSYWKSTWVVGNPAWLDAQNPKWKGNYKVKFWDPAWEAILMARLDALIDAGYDGVFLDVVDAYEYYKTTRPTAAADMQELLERLAAHARQRAGADFGFFPNGGEALLADPTYMAMITGIMKESMFFSGSVATPLATSVAMQAALHPAVNEGKLVLSIDYTANLAQQKSAYAQAAVAGFKEYVSLSALDKLVEISGLQPAPSPSP